MIPIAVAAAAADLGAVVDSLREVTVGVEGDGYRRGMGAGIIWPVEGVVVTNAHCVRQREVTVLTADGRSFNAAVIAHDARLDLAVLDAPPLRAGGLELRDADALRPGELLVALGHPLGVSGALTVGVLHAVARDSRSGDARWVCADLRLAPGNSGGPLADAAGRIVGVNTMVVGGLGLAIPASVVQRFVARVRSARAA